MKIISLEAVCHTKDGEPCVKMDFLSRNQHSILFRLWWALTRWKRTEFTLTVVKETGRLL